MSVVVAKSKKARFAAFVSGIIASTGFTAALGLTLFFGWLSHEMGEGDTKSFDDSVRAFVHGFASPLLTAIMIFFSFLGSSIFIIVALLAVLTTFLTTGHRRSAIVFAVTIAGGLILESALKIFFARTRPEPFFDVILPSTYSYPSGHSFFSFCFYGSLAWIYLRHSFSNFSKIIVSVFTALLILAVGTSRIYLGVHYPSDVVAGFIVALTWLIGVVAADSYFSGPEKTENIKSKPK